ncbi:MAG: response regulator [Faecalibacillus faecis]
MRIIEESISNFRSRRWKKTLEMIKEDKSIDLVLLDIVMPNMDGYQVLEKMKEQRYLEYLPVIIISSEGDTTSMEKAYELGATDYQETF